MRPEVDARHVDAVCDPGSRRTGHQPLLAYIDPAAGNLIYQSITAVLLLDSCRSFSFYNRSTFGNGLSPVDPVLTTFVLWPRQFPAGLLKNPPFAAQQRRLAEEIFSFVNSPLRPKQGVLRFVHFSVPHPFVFNVDGYHPSWDPLRTSPDDQYVDQVRYADRLFGELLTDLRHIPFNVRRAGQRERADVRTEEPGELLLRRVLESACSRTDY